MPSADVKPLSNDASACSALAVHVCSLFQLMLSPCACLFSFSADVKPLSNDASVCSAMAVHVCSLFQLMLSPCQMMHVVPWQCMFALLVPLNKLSQTVLYFTLVVYALGYIQTFIKRSKVSKEHCTVS
jgi:hypothetical protein